MSASFGDSHDLESPGKRRLTYRLFSGETSLGRFSQTSIRLLEKRQASNEPLILFSIAVSTADGPCSKHTPRIILTSASCDEG